VPISESVEPSFTKFRSDRELPICKKSSTAMDEPNRDAPRREIDELRRWKPRKLRVLPRCRKSRTESENTEPKFEITCNDSDDPKHAKLRKLNELPNMR
jgi:hypothetical protein